MDSNQHEPESTSRGQVKLDGGMNWEPSPHTKEYQELTMVVKDALAGAPRLKLLGSRPEPRASSYKELSLAHVLSQLVCFALSAQHACLACC